VQLYDYQREGVRFLVRRRGALLADQMGLGKTVQAIAAADSIPQKVLICTKSTLLSQWEQEIKRFSQNKCIVVHGPRVKRQELWKQARAAGIKYVICSYDTVKLADDMNAAADIVRGGILILDEATAVKNYKAQRSKALWKIRKGADRVYALTGTPYENHLTEYYQILRFVSPSLFPRYDIFKATYLKTRKIKVGLREVEIIVGERNLEHFRRMTEPVLLRRTRNEVLQLPPEQTIIHTITMSAAQKRQEKWMLDEAIVNRTSTLTVFTRCLQNIISPGLINDKEPIQSPLLDEAYEVCDEIVQNGDKVIIFSTFVTALQAFHREYLQKNGYRVGFITGAQKDMDIIHDVDCLLISTAAGYGLNLQDYHYMVFLNEPLNPAVAEQVRSRIMRIGQQSPVQYHKMHTENSVIEQRVREMLAKKRTTSEFLLAKYAVTEQLDAEGETETDNLYGYMFQGEEQNVF